MCLDISDAELIMFSNDSCLYVGLNCALKKFLFNMQFSAVGDNTGHSWYQQNVDTLCHTKTLNLVESYKHLPK